MIALILHIAVALLIVGLIVWLVLQFPGIDESMKALIKKIAIVISVICVVFYLLHAFGLLGSDIPVPRVG